MKTFLSMSLLIGALLGFSVIIGQAQAIAEREYPVVIHGVSDEIIYFTLAYVGGFSSAAAIYAYIGLKLYDR